MFGLPYSYHPSLTFHGPAISFQLIWLNPHSQFPSLMTQNFEVFVLFCFIYLFFLAEYIGQKLLWDSIFVSPYHQN